MKFWSENFSETFKDYSVALFTLVATVCVVITTLNVSSFVKDTKQDMRDISGSVVKVSDSTAKLERSVRDTTVNFNKVFLHDKQFLAGVKTSISAITKDFHSLMVNEIKPTMVEVRTTVQSSNRLIVNIDENLNGSLLPETANLIRNLDQRTGVIIDKDLHGFLTGTQGCIEDVTRDLQTVIQDPEIPLILKQIRLTMENGEQATCYVAEILWDASETSEFYKKKLIHPSPWDIVKNMFLTAVYIGGEIVVPFAVSNKVKAVEVLGK